MCDKNCSTTSCPFACTEESEVIQNLGCLPSPTNILAMRVLFGKTWACHSDNSKPCVGAIKSLQALGHDYKVIDKTLITEETFSPDDFPFNSDQYYDVINPNNISIFPL